LHRRHGIQKTSSQTPQTSIAKAGIGLLLNQLQPINTFFLDRLLN
jgi:hypothetical protein